jgi:hypothetical protein
MHWSLAIDTTHNALEVTGLSPGSYMQTNYYYGFVDQSMPSFPDYGPQNTFLLGGEGRLQLEHPTMQLPESPFMLFRTEEQNSPFRIDPTSGAYGTIVGNGSKDNTNHIDDATTLNHQHLLLDGVEQVNGGIQVYPNPVENGTFNIAVDDIVEMNWNYQLFDISGRTVHIGRSSSPVKTISINHLAKGSYLIKVTTKNFCKTFDLVYQ